MFSQRLLNRLRIACLCLAVISVAACGGAESRRARHLEKGRDFLAAGNFDKARVEFRNALQISPTDSEARYENGVVDEKLGNVREAAQFYQGALEVNAENLPARIGLGRLFVFGGAPERALETVKPGLEKHPDDPGLLTVRAAARVQTKDLEGAQKDAERALSLAPASEDAISVLAGIYKMQDHADKAQALLEDGIRRIPASVDLRISLSQLYASIGQDAKVEEMLRDIVRLKPGEKSHRLRLAQFYARLNRNDEAEKVLREAIGAFPADTGLKATLIEFLAARRGRDQAAHALDAMIAAEPGASDVRLLKAEFEDQGGETAKAQASYEAVIAAAGTDATGITARNRLALMKIRNGDEAGAKKLLADVLAKNPRDSEALVISGNLALAQKDPKTAIADLRAVLRDQPNAVGVMRSLSRAHLANGEPALAEETMRRAVDADPRDHAARLDLAQLLVEIGKPEQAKPIVEELVRQQPDDLNALQTAFRVDVATGDRAGAHAAADAMVAAHPDDSLGHFDQGAVAEEEKRHEDALRDYAAALAIKPQATEPLEAMARILANTGRMPEALKKLDDSAAQFPQWPVPLNIRGDLLLSAGRAADAQQAYTAAIAREPRWWVPYRGLAATQAAGGQGDAAETTLRTAITKVSQPEPLEAELARYLERRGKVDEAVALYEQILQRNPDAENAANNLAVLLVGHRSDRASLDRAKALTSRFSGSTNPQFLDTYGWVLFKRGDATAALVPLQSSVSRAPQSPLFAYHLGMVQAQLGQTDAARASLTRAVAAAPRFDGIDEAKTTLERLNHQPAAATPPKT